MEVINTRPLLKGDTDSEDESEVYGSSSINDELVDDTKPIFKHTEPNDHYKIAYCIFYLLGITTLLPLNFFITADDYWMYKFRDLNSTAGLLNFMTARRTPLQASFISYVTIASNVPTILVLMLNAALIHRISLHVRIIGSLTTMLALFIITTVFVKINTDSWQQEFFYVTMAIVIVLNMAAAAFLGSLIGAAGKFAPQYITATFGGQSLGGAFASIAQIIALSIGASSEHSAFVHFAVGNVVIFISIISYLVLAKMSFFKYHISDKMGTLNTIQDSVQRGIISYKFILKKITLYVATATLVFAVTLSVYPGVAVLIESEGKGHGFKWNDIYFVPVITYLLFNIGDYTGRLLAGRCQWPQNPWQLLVINILRITFIPLLLFCNAQPRKHLGVIFDKDIYYIIMIILFSFTNGYFISISVLVVPRVVDMHEKETAVSIMSVFIGAGLVAGSFLSMLLVKCL